MSASTGVWSRTPATTATVRDRFPFVGRVYASAEELLADPEVRYVDLATGPEGRLDWIEAAVDAGKHVLAQKPLTLSAADLDRLPALLARAEAAGVRVAVNHNGRWAPRGGRRPCCVRDGRIGDLVGVTHLHDKPLPPLVGTPFDDVPHMLLTDYLLHWVDITRTWLADGGAGRVMSVQAADSRVPGQPDEARNPWAATLSMTAATGATAVLRIAGNVVSVRRPAVRSGCTAPTGRCGAACCWTPTAWRSTTDRPAPPCHCAGRGSSTASRLRSVS